MRARGKGRRIKSKGKSRQTGKVERVKNVEKELDRGEARSPLWKCGERKAEARAGDGHCEPRWCGLRSNFLSLRWRRSFLFFCLGFLSPGQSLFIGHFLDSDNTRQLAVSSCLAGPASRTRVSRPQPEPQVFPLCMQGLQLPQGLGSHSSWHSRVLWWVKVPGGQEGRHFPLYR